MHAVGFLPQLADPFPHRYVLNVQLLIPGKPRDGNSAIADQGFPPLCSIAFEEIQMAFVNEVVSDEDIVKYNLPFKPGAGRYWTRDKERDCYLWGGINGSFIRESPVKGEFYLYIHGVLLEIWLQPEDAELPSFITSAMLSWRRITLMRPYDLGGLGREEAVEILKEALLVFGVNGSPVAALKPPKVKILF